MEARTFWLACWDLSEGRILSLSGEKEPSMQRTQEGVVFQEDRMAGEKAPWYMSLVCLKHRKELLWLEHREAGRWGQGLGDGVKDWQRLHYAGMCQLWQEV